MGVQEYLMYGLSVAAVFAIVWATFGRGYGEGGVFTGDREGGWNRLPNIFKLVWPIAVTYESPLGTSLVNWFYRQAERINALTVTSALPLNPARVYSSCAFLGLIFGFVGLVAAVLVFYALPDKLGYWPPAVVFVLLFFMGWYWPINNLKVYVKKRRDELARQLPFAIDLIAASMRSGLEFGAAMRYYVDSGVKGALHDELEMVLGEVQLGKTIPVALERMAGRISMPSFTSFVDAIAYGQEVGAPIANTLKVHGEELRRRRFAAAEQRAARAPHFMILPLICFIMPAVFIVTLTPLIMQFIKMMVH